MNVYACTKRCRNCEKYGKPDKHGDTSKYYCVAEECLVEEPPKSKEELILENYLNQGFKWIYKYEDKNKWNNSGKYGTRIFYTEPWFSIEGGMTWVDVYSCNPFVNENKGKQAEFIELNIVDLKEPIRIEEYIEKYCS